MTTSITAAAQSPKAKTAKKTFSRETTVSVQINAGAEIVWALLTNGQDYTRWNSTITYFEGEVEEREKIKLRSTLDPKRTFKLKVKSMEAEKSMTWVSGTAPFFRGVRTYTLSQNPDGTVICTMTEKIGGLMFPMAAGSIPDFDQSFEQFASDLKKEAEIIQNAK